MNAINVSETHYLFSRLSRAKKLDAYSDALVKIAKARDLEASWIERLEIKPDMEKYSRIMKKYIPAAIMVTEFYYEMVEEDKTLEMSRSLMNLTTSKLKVELDRNVNVCYKYGNYSLCGLKDYADKICKDLLPFISYIEFAYK